MAQKFDAQFPFRLPSETKEALIRIAGAKESDAQELLRRACYAIVAYAIEHGDKAVPLDMEIVPEHGVSAHQVQVAEELYKHIKKAENKKG